MTGLWAAQHTLWPVRYKPREDELLSSWLIRVSHGMGIKVQTLCNLEFGNQRQVWNRDIDRFGPDWLIESMSRRTGTPLATAHGTTLRSFDGVLYRRFKSSGALPWVLGLQMYHRTWRGHGLMYCPACLADGGVSYYRKAWRLAMNTVCPHHGCMLLDRCPACGAGVGFTRVDLGKPMAEEFADLSLCHACGFDLRSADAPPPIVVDSEALALLTELQEDLLRGDRSPEFVESAELLHVLCSFLTKQTRALNLAPYLAARLGTEINPSSTSRLPIEYRSVGERHQLLQMAAWVMADPVDRLGEAIQAKALRFNHLLRDNANIPSRLVNISLELPHRKLSSEHERPRQPKHKRKSPQLI